MTVTAALNFGPPYATTVPEALSRAADLIALDGGWFQIRKGGAKGRDCAGTAVGSVCGIYAGRGPGEREHDFAVFNAAVRALHLHLVDAGAADNIQNHYSAVNRWNDQPDRTQDQVAAALREVAEIEEAKAATS